jgi:hypothetical protein
MEAAMFDSVCEIRRAGVTADGKALLDLKAVDGTFDWSWMVSSPERTREVLAVALAALTTGKTVFCTIDDPIGPWSTVGTFGL